MNAAVPAYKQTLLKEYRNRDIGAIIQVVTDLTKSPEFPALYGRWVKENKIPQATLRIEEIAKVLLDELDNDLKRRQNSSMEASFYMIAESLEKKFNKEVSLIYLETQEPDDLLESARFFLTGDQEAQEEEKLSEAMVERFKQKLIRIEKGRRALVYILQSYCNFPIKHVVALSALLDGIHKKLKAGYHYISVKPMFWRILAISDLSLGEDDNVLAARLKAEKLSLFNSYVAAGEEPSLWQLVELRIAVSKLFKFISNNNILPQGECNEIRNTLVAIWSHKGLTGLSYKARKILEETLAQVNKDRSAVICRLAETFVGEYRTSEREMAAIQQAIAEQLAYTKQYLERSNSDNIDLNEIEQENINVAQEKLVGLDGVFDIALALERAQEASFGDLERVALGVASAVSVDRLVVWILIYSIIFSNREFLKYARGEVDLSLMRAYISNLSTYHLIQNVATLRALVDRALAKEEKEVHSEFKRFNEALKIKLQSLIKSKQAEEKSFQDMIKDLEFIKDAQVQFLLAEAFKGFQILANSFNSSAESYFVQDERALVKESKEIYQNICSQCLKNFMHRPVTLARKEKPKEKKKVGWFARWFR